MKGSADMLKLIDIKKKYRVGNTKIEALKGISLDFRQKEFVAILGASGCGKTTMLNIIGGLDHYSSGDLIIDNVSTKHYRDKEWDAYRNNCIGFIFQSYNLIGHISVLTNVEMSMTLSGYSRSERKKKAFEALDRVGLKDQALKKPNQLSGGQMQRVAIARALVNDPEIILADEPTGALDSITSGQIMELIKEISLEKLVIMVTHNPEIAKQFATRIVQIKDGEILSDSNPVQKKEENSRIFKIKKTAMGYGSALHLSFNNIKTKKGRTFLTAFASSIGIIGIALILALSNGFQKQIDIFERDSLSQMPIQISQQQMQMDPGIMLQYEAESKDSTLPKYSDQKVIMPLEDVSEALLHTNIITKEYIEYIHNIDKDLIGGVSFTRAAKLNMIIKKSDGTYSIGTTSDRFSDWTVLPDIPKGSEESSAITSNFDVLAGNVDSSKPGIILMVDSHNRIAKSSLEQLGLDPRKDIEFDKILKTEFKIASNDDYYKVGARFFTVNQDYQELYNSKNSLTVKVQAILRGKKEKELITSGTGIMYTSALVDKAINMNKDSVIVKQQLDKDYNVITGQPFEKNENSINTKDNTMALLGADAQPVGIYVFPKNFESKDKILSYLDKYNEGKSKKDTVQYLDMAKMISSLSGNIMGAITIVLIALSAISLIVSSIMIGIITYISVLERTKEIGVLRALGARKRDISRVFNAETMIIGLCSGLLGIGIAQLLTFPANVIIENLSGLPNVATLNPIHAIILITISIILTLIGGFIPAKMASKKDPVTALRTE